MDAPRTSRGKRTTGAWAAYKLRWNRRALLARSWRKRRQLRVAQVRIDAIRNDDILCFATVRNEAHRLPHWLNHHRALGVSHFIIVDNDSTDETGALLDAEPDVSRWTTTHSYKAARFGMDWIGHLQARIGHGHWCLTLDADELLIYPNWEDRPLRDLTDWLDASGLPSFGATMLDLYPNAPLGRTAGGGNPLDQLQWFDAHPYWVQKQPKLENLWLQGGVRARQFFAEEPERAPTLNKVPLVRWHWRYSYVSSTHTMLPRSLNHTYDEGGRRKPTGVLLHTKFWDGVVDKTEEEQKRRQHFQNSALYQDYYAALLAQPNLWTDESVRYEGWQQLLDLGLMQRGDWPSDRPAM